MIAGAVDPLDTAWSEFSPPTPQNPSPLRDHPSPLAMPFATPHRIDPASNPSPISVQRKTPRRVASAVPDPICEPVQAADQSPKSSVAPEDPSPDTWLKLHASDLIQRLKRWAAALEARELQLDIRMSQADQRDRQFRLQQGAAQRELDQQRESVERLRTQLRAHARRMEYRSS